MNLDNVNLLSSKLHFTKGIKKTLSLLLVTVMLLTSVDFTGLGMITARAEENSAVYVPDIKWRRSIETGPNRQVLKNDQVFMNWKNAPTWDWNDVKNIGLGLTDESSIWDGGTNNPYFANHRTNIESATWKNVGLRRFQGEFTIPEEYTTNDFIRLKSNNQSNYSSINDGNIIPINDDIFIFVYKKGQEINNDNYMNYLAFWTGVDNQNNILVFHGVKGTPVKRYIPPNEKSDKNFYVQNKVNYKNHLKSSDGWAAEANLDNIGSTLFKNYPAQNGEFIIDIFTYDTSSNGGGGMDKLILEFAANKEYSVEIRYWEDTVGEGGTFLDSETLPGLKLNEEIVLDKKTLNKHKRSEDYLDGVQQNAPYKVIEHKGYIDVVYKSATKIQAIKKWEDGSNQDGVRPFEVKVQLYAGDTPKGDPVSLNTKLNWKYEWNEALQDEAGNLIQYSVKELDTLGQPVENNEKFDQNYTTTYSYEGNQTTITNTYKPATTQKKVIKKWEDNNNQDGKRQNVKVQLMAGDMEKDNPVELNETNGWTHTWENLPAKSSGKDIIYTVKEITEIPGYTTTYSPSSREFADNEVTITNTLKPETIDIPVEKHWKDHNDEKKARPSNITIQLYQQIEEAEKTPVKGTVELTESESWKTIYKDLPKYNNGKEIIYSVEEKSSVPGYEAPIYTTETKDGVKTLVITNVLDQEYMDIEGEKIWIDGNDTASRKTVEIMLYANGKPVNDQNGEPVKALASQEANWNFEFENLPKYDDDRNIINYTVEEITEVQGYISKADGTKIINTRSDIDEQINIKVIKHWIDGGDKTQRPELTFTLTRNKEVVEHAKAESTGDNTWEFKNLPKYDKDGAPYEYEVSEHVNPNGALENNYKQISYISPDNTNDFTASFTNKRKDMDETATITVNKVWKDGGDNNRRPSSITFSLYQNEKEMKDIEPVTLTKADQWNPKSFAAVPKRDSEGYFYHYTVKENAVSGYEHLEDQDIQPKEENNYVATIVNRRSDNNDTTDITVKKEWRDGGDINNRPESISFQLKQNDKSYGKPLNVTADMSWECIFKEVPKYDETGQLYKYEVEEGNTKNYSSFVKQQPTKDNEYTAVVVNTRGDIDAMITLQVEKEWVDGNDINNRPDEVIFEISRNGDLIEPTISITAESSWSGETSIKKYDIDGKPYEYSIKEKTVNGYSSKITQQPSEDNKYLGKAVNTRSDINNKIAVTVEKVWADNNNTDNRPDEITFELLQNGNSFEPVKTLSMTKASEWTAVSFKNLDQYDSQGKEIIYSVKENPIPNYTCSIVEEPSKKNGYQTIVKNSRDDINTVIDKITVEKIWKDGDDSQGLRPESITFELLRGGKSMEPRATKTMTKADNWSPIHFEGYPKFDTKTGTPYEYEITEQPVEHYSTPSITQPNEANGYHGIVTNYRDNIDETIAITVNKTWIDNGTNRPDQITFILKKNGKVITSKNMTKENDWSHITFEDLRKYDDSGYENLYEVEESSVENYKPQSIQPTSENDYQASFTNSRADLEELIDIKVNKTWIDGNDETLRPDSIVFNLLLDGSIIDAKEMNKSNDWKLTFEDLAKCDANGNTLEYYLEEEPIPGYMTTDIIQPSEGNRYEASFTNTFQTATVEISAQKKLADYTTHEALDLTNGLFTFKLMKGDTTLQTVRNDSDGNITFKPLTFSYKDEGEQTFKIVEATKLDDSVDPEGYHFDQTTFLVRVNVEINEDNSLTVTELYEHEGEAVEKDEIVFENLYETPINDLIIRKQLIGDSSETFQFTLALNGDAYVGTYTIGNDEFETEDGILYIPGNKQAVVKGIRKGTEYTVTEIDTKGYAVMANGEAANSITGIMRSKLESTPVAEFINIPKDKLAISKTRIGGNSDDIFTFNLKYNRANASDATPGDSDVGTPSNQRSSSKRNNYKTKLDEIFGNDDNSMYLFKGSYDLYTQNSDGKLSSIGKKTAANGNIKLKGGEIAVINNFVVDTEYEITEVFEENSSYRLAEISAPNPFTGSIATGSNAELEMMSLDLTDDFANLANFVNVFKYSEIRTRYHIRHIDINGKVEDKIQGSIPDSGYDRFEVDKDLGKLGAEYFNELFKSNGKENTYDLASITLIKETANNKEEIIYSNTARNIGNALTDFNLTDLEQDAVYKINVDFIQVRGAVVLNKTGLNGAKLEGAKFQLYNSNDEKVGGILTTNSDGIIIKENLLPGQYYFVETSAPAGYVTDNTPHQFELTADNGYMAVAEITVENQLDTGSVLLKKVDSTGNGLQGVVFSLYHADGEKVNSEDLTTDVNGEIRVNGLELGSYYFTEEEALKGFVKDDTEIHFTITFEDIVSNKVVTPDPFVNNYEENGVIWLTKTDRDGNPLANAVFDLYKSGDASPIRSNLTTSEDGKIIVTDLPIGQYYFVETKAPEGYVTPQGNEARSKMIEIKFAENIRDNQIAEVTIINELQTGSVKLTKTDVAETKLLRGAEFDLYNLDGTLVKSGLVTDANGVIIYPNLPAGSYYFKETKAPTGYQLPDDEDALTHFTVEHGIQTEINVTNIATGNNNDNGGGNSSGGSGGSGSGGSSTPGGPGTTIPETPVPLANLPGSGNGSDGTLVINDGLVPLANLPKTGDSPFKALMTLFSGLMLGLAAMIGKKKKGEE